MSRARKIKVFAVLRKDTYIKTTKEMKNIGRKMVGLVLF